MGAVFRSSLLIKKIVEALAAESIDLGGIFLVGGAVRDAVLSRASHDLDFVVKENSIQIARRVADALGGAYFTLDEEFQVGRVVLVEEDQPHQVFDFVKLQGMSLNDDLYNRDFTLNAMAVALDKLDEIIDPLGGLQDLVNHQLKPCSTQSLSSDPVRVLRAVRMAAKYALVIPPETRQLVAGAVPGLRDVSAERLRDEFFKILDAPRPAASLRVLDRFGALGVLIPEIEELKGVQQSPPHIYDLWEHTLHTIQGMEEILTLLDENYVHDNEMGGDLFSGLLSQRLGRYRAQISEHLAEELVPERSARTLIFLAALLHDITKPSHHIVDQDGRIRFTGHEVSGAKLTEQIGARMKLSRNEIHRLVRAVTDHARPWHLAKAEEAPSNTDIYRFWRDNETAGIDVCLLELADLRGAYGHTLTKDLMERHLDTARALLEGYFECPQVVSPETLLDGKQLMGKFGIAPGPVIGELLNALTEAQVEGEVQTRDQAFAFVSAYLSKLKV